MRGRKMGAVLLVAGAALAACEGGSGARAPSGREQAPVAAPSGSAREQAPVAGARPVAQRQPFVVAIVVDQLSAWVAETRWPELPEGGGFARLRREGTWVKKLRYPYAVTDTAPGHASLHTGKLPSETGIFGNEVPDAAGGRVSILRDDAVKPVMPEGPRAGAGASAARLKVDTVADRLRAARPDALVVSVSVKDRGAILPAGKRPTHVLWFDAALDSFVTSTAFSETYPRWAIGVGDTRAVVAARARPWELTDAAWVKAHAATPDDQPGEGDLDGMGIVFPHRARTAAAFRALPASDEMIVALGLAAVEAEYDPARPTLLLLSMSASDVVGHVYGPDSWEAWDHLRKLDATLGKLLDALDRRAGAPVSVLLAADHGNISMPEVDPRRRPGCDRPASVPADAESIYGWPCTKGERLGVTALRDELVTAAKKALGAGHWVAGVADPYVFLTPEARALPADRLAILDRAILTTLAGHKAIAKVYDAATLAAVCPTTLRNAPPMPVRASLDPRLGLLPLVCRSWGPDAGAGDYYVIPIPGAFFDGEIVVGKGTSHGTPYAYDRTVAMLVRAPGAIDAGAVLEAPVDFAAYAALQAAFVGLDARAPREILAAHRALPEPVRAAPARNP